MLKEIISRDDNMLSEYARNAYRNIPILEFSDDYSFTYTMMMVYGNSINIDGAYHSVRSDNASSLYLDDKNYLEIVSCPSKEVVDSLAESVKNLGFEEVEKCHLMFVKAFDVRVLVNNETCHYLMLVERMNVQRWHAIQLSIAKIFVKEKFTEFDKRVFNALTREESSMEYVKCMNEFIEQNDFYRMALKNMLDGMELRSVERNIRNWEDQMSSNFSNIRSYEDYIANALAQNDLICSNILGARETLKNIKNRTDDSTLVQYFMSHPAIHLESANDSEIKYTVYGYVSQFDHDFAESYIENTDSYLYDNLHGFRVGDLKLLLTKIFIDEDLKLRMNATYRLNLEGKSWRGLSGENYDRTNSYMPNPHIYHYSCTGGFDSDVHEALRSNNYTGVLDISIISNGSINIKESCTIQRMMNMLLEDRIACIELSNGFCTTVSGAIDYIKREMKED